MPSPISSYFTQIWEKSSPWQFYSKFPIFGLFFRNLQLKSGYNLMITTKTLQIPSTQYQPVPGVKKLVSKNVFFIFQKNKSFSRKILHGNYQLDVKKTVTSRIFVLGGQFLYQIKLLWSSNFDKRTGIIGIKEKKLRFFLRSKFCRFWRFS